MNTGLKSLLKRIVYTFLNELCNNCHLKQRVPSSNLLLRILIKAAFFSMNIFSLYVSFLRSSNILIKVLSVFKTKNCLIAVLCNSRSSHRECSVGKGVLKNFSSFTGKHLCWSLSLKNLTSGFQSCNFIKKRFQHRGFPVKLGKFFRTHILKNICERLLL